MLYLTQGRSCLQRTGVVLITRPQLFTKNRCCAYHKAAVVYKEQVLYLTQGRSCLQRTGVVLNTRPQLFTKNRFFTYHKAAVVYKKRGCTEHKAAVVYKKQVLCLSQGRSCLQRPARCEPPHCGHVEAHLRGCCWCGGERVCAWLRPSKACVLGGLLAAAWQPA